MRASQELAAAAPLLAALVGVDVVALDSGLTAGGSAYIDVAVRGLAGLQAFTRRMGDVQATVEGEAVVDLSLDISHATTQPDWLVLSVKVESLTSPTGAPPKALLDRMAASYRRASRAARRTARTRR